MHIYDYDNAGPGGEKLHFSTLTKTDINFILNWSDMFICELWCLSSGNTLLNY